MEKYPNGAGFRPEIEDVWPLDDVREEDHIEIPTRESLGMRKTKVDMTVVVNVIVAILAICALLFAMHGDQVALENGWIH